jgi:uncharacterized cupredoxin-like copper-binding protein
MLLVLALGVLAALSLSDTQAQTQNSTATNITFYAGELYDANGTLQHGAFGVIMTNLTSPGPTLNFTAGQTVNLTLVNVGKVGHGWALTDQPQTNATVLFNATIANATTPLAPNATGSVNFTIANAGTYYYICPVPGHVALGMWGMVNVTAAINASVSPTPTTSTSASPSPTSTSSASPTSTVTTSPTHTATATPSKSPTPSPTIPELSAIVLIGIMAAAVATALIGKKRLNIPVA